MIHSGHSLFWVKDGMRSGSCLVFDEDDNTLLYVQFFAEGRILNEVKIHYTDVVEYSNIMADDEFDVMSSDLGDKHYYHYKQCLLHGKQYAFHGEKCYISDFVMGEDVTVRSKRKKNEQQVCRGDKVLSYTKFWHNTSEPRIVEDYETGTITKYNRQGRLLSITTPGKKSGQLVTKTYGSKGQLRSVEKTVNGVLQGKFIHYRSIDTVITGKYKDDKKHGLVTTTRRGKISKIETYSMGILKQEQVFHYNGSVTITNFVDGLKDGPEVTIKDGIYTTRQWHNGELV